MARRGQHRSGPGGTPATVELAAAAVPFTEHEYAHDPRAESYGLEAAQALGLDPQVVYKTLLVTLESAAGSVAHPMAVVIVPVERHVDLKAAAHALGAKRAAMADPAAAQRSTGYVVGGISPFGQRRRLPTVLDAAAAGHETIYVSGGRRGYDLGVAPDDLVRVLGAIVAPVAR